MKVFGTQTICVEISEAELARALFQKVQEYVGEIDDAGCDWLTDGDSVYIGDESWLVCKDERVAALVNAANVLLCGKVLPLRR